MGFKFEKLEVWQMSLEYVDLIYTIAEKIPRAEEYNLKSQIIQAATSVALNLAEGSTSQSDPEFSRFLGLSIRSLVETVACLRLIQRRSYVVEDLLNEAYAFAEKLFARLQALRKSLRTADGGQRTINRGRPTADSGR
jgi:four helix bundle protein